MIDDIDAILSDYYAWARVKSPDDIGFPHATPERRLLGSSVSSPKLTDDEAMCIDAALGHLKSEAPDEYFVIHKIYKGGC